MQTAVPCFESVEALQAGLAAKQSFAAVDLYPRDGTARLAAVEARIAELARVEEDELVLCGSGMAAVIGAIEATVEAGQTLAYSELLYSQTEAYITYELPKRGVKVVRFDPGSLDDIDRVIGEYHPEALVSETVANNIGASVLDIPGLLSLASVQEANPYVILDHTLPLSTGQALAPYLGEAKKVIGIESGTKSYTFNSELCGLIYSANPQILHRIRSQRRTRGFLPNLGGIERIDELLPASLAAFDHRNTSIAEATAELAEACQTATADNPDITVWHPLVNHLNSDIVDRDYDTPGTPVLFLSCWGEDSQVDLAKRLWSHPGVREQCELGQSFGFDSTRILYDANFPLVRIAGGAKTDARQLGQALQEAIN